ncbi:hypothetical protein NDU88_001404 [Pleurodeles waltl]|uniref:Uncharacterized protein n=1 Tax=Pleurodeles waltl TaxID=8319 RepID=A0AAV7WMJ9_PLEWA|nr:hypothetical protein NDU88_001404 [Pleurodeles waltl]
MRAVNGYGSVYDVPVLSGIRVARPNSVVPRTGSAKNDAIPRVTGENVGGLADLGRTATLGGRGSGATLRAGIAPGNDAIPARAAGKCGFPAGVEGEHGDRKERSPAA